ncbi:Hypothetical predicted protein, partial [Pelobates cultripes]
MEDLNWNVKIRGILETVIPDELPHYIRRLLTTLLTSKHAKQALIDGVFASQELPETQQNPQGMSYYSKQGQYSYPPTPLKTPPLCFYQDLSRPNL